MADVTMLKHFEFAHLPPKLQAVSEQFYQMASWLVDLVIVVDERERQVALRKLLEAKDAAVRSVVVRD